MKSMDLQSAMSERTYEPLTLEHLDRLAEIARQDRLRFVAKQPDLRNQFLASALVQGGAQHWVDGKHGVKDLDVYSFFALPRGYARFPADIRQVHADFGRSELGRAVYDPNWAKSGKRLKDFERWSQFEGRRVDLMLRGLAVGVSQDPVGAIQAWLRSGRSERDGSRWYLAQRPVILIEPSAHRGEVIWPVSAHPNEVRPSAVRTVGRSIPAPDHGGRSFGTQ